MAKVGRNETCPCGSGRKAKRCCYSAERLEAEVQVRRRLRTLVAQSLPDLADVDGDELRELVHQAIHLPERDLSLQVRLPALASPEVERAAAALLADDDYEFDDWVMKVALQLATPERRLEVAQAVADLRDQDKIDRRVAAVALLDLGEASESAVFLASVAESIAVSAGRERTPSGLLVAS